MDLDPTTFATMEPAEFARTVKGMSDGEIREVMTGEHRTAILDAILGRFPVAFLPEKNAGRDARINFRITDGPNDSSDTYAIVVDSGVCTIEKEPTVEPSVSIMLGPAEFARLVTGTGNPVMMVMTGKIKARGDLGLATAFQAWFDSPSA